MIVGRLLQRAAEQMRERLGGAVAGGVLPQARVVRRHRRSTRGRRSSSGTTSAISGDAYGSYGWGCNVVELEVDPDTWQVTPTQGHGGRRDRQGDSSGDGGRPDRRRHGAGPRLRAARRGRDARRAHGQRALTNYIIPTPPDTPPIETRHSRAAVQARSVRRERRRRDADRRAGAGGGQRAAARRLRRARDSGDAGAADDALQRSKRAPAAHA